MRRVARRNDGWRHPLERPAAVYLDEDDPPEEPSSAGEPTERIETDKESEECR